METPKLFLPEEVDELLRLKKGQASRLARRGELPHIQVGREIRFPADEIERLLTPKPVVGQMRLVGAQ
jgi:excisionase family DNA binding protein